ncbi:MAG: mannose-1-phosphate guanylyltransferase/mannose-6-phosphate isomerase [Sulfitobacter sp.]
MTRITPVILCGGSGTRLWPVSRRSYPKQFAKLIGPETLFQACARRLQGPLLGAQPGVEFAPPIAITNADFRFIVPEQLQQAGIDPGPVLIEPQARNTGPAVLAAALYAAAQDPEALLLVAPSDHVIEDIPAFHAAIGHGIRAACDDGALVTFGITPTRPETGYGYLELPARPDGPQAVALKAFVEKPDAARAAQMLESGQFLWNAGLFLFSARTLLEAYQAHAPQLLGPVADAVEQAQVDLGFLRLAPEAWAKADDISIDYAVMEKADNLAVVPLSADWSDLGSWDAVRQQSTPDARGVALHGTATAIDCDNTLLRAEDSNIELVGLGLKNILAVATGDAVLVADMSRAQDVKLAVEALKAKGAKQAEAFAMDHRPWGHFETLALADRFQVKRIVVKPGAALSLQSHVHRAEHWIVVAGTARVTIDDEVKLVGENQSVYIPLGAKHRMENPGKLPMVLIEVQTGAYLGEDDIIRYEDIYARAREPKKNAD